MIRRDYAKTHDSVLDCIAAQIEDDTDELKMVTDWEDTNIARIKRHMDRDAMERNKYLEEHSKGAGRGTVKGRSVKGGVQPQGGDIEGHGDALRAGEVIPVQEEPREAD